MSVQLPTRRLDVLRGDAGALCDSRREAEAAFLVWASWPTYLYDKNGNVTKIEEAVGETSILDEEMYYDALNRMTKYTGPRGTEEFAYRGAEWHRRSQTHGGSTTKFLYDGDNVIADVSGTSVAKMYVTPFLDQNLSMTIPAGVADAGTYYYSHDGLGSVRTVTNATPTVVNRYDYTAFGETWAMTTSETVPQRYGFTGQERNPVSGTMFYGYRTYDPRIGRFGGRDPIYSRGGINAYAYVENSPTIFTDPFGLEPTICCCTPNQKDATAHVNKLVNDVLTRAAGAANATNQSLRQAIENSLIGPAGYSTLTGIERQLKQDVKDGKIDGGTKTGPTPFGSADCLLICGKCIGTDTIGHFFEEGLAYFDVKQGKGEEYAKALGYFLEGLVPPNMPADVQQWLQNGSFRINFAGRVMNYPTGGASWGAFGDEAGGTPLDPKGSASPADIAANEAGMRFWSQMMGGNSVSAIKSGARFDICSYAKGQWDQKKNPNVPGAPRGTPPFSQPPASSAAGGAGSVRTATPASP